MAYIDLPIETDPEALKDDAIEYLTAAFPGWQAAAGNLEVVLIEAIAEMATEQAEVASSVPSAIFRAFGQKTVGIDPIDGVQAIGVTSWTLSDTLGHTIPAGTYLVLGDVAFQTSEEVTVPIGVSSATVNIVAVDPGEAGNGLTGAATLVDTLAYVTAVTVTGSTSGGVDAETDDEYLARLADELQLMAPRPIVPQDFEILARRIAGVDRAVAVDGYDPHTDTYDNERMIALAAVDAEGENVSGTIQDEIEAYLEARREVNFVVNVIDPTYTTIDVTATVTILPGFDVPTVLSTVEAALNDYLDPANWGRASSGDGRFDRPWINTQTVGYLNIARAILMVEGVAFIGTLTVEGGGVDVDLSGDPAPLTRPGTMTITAV
jgi:uncharacterized phage protein gp47/JayE